MSIYGGLRIKLIDSHSDPLIFRCSNTDPVFVLDSSNNKSAELRITNKNGKYVAMKPSDDMEESYTLTLPINHGVFGNILTSKGDGGTKWSNVVTTTQTFSQENNFSIESSEGNTTIYLGNATNTTEGTWRIESSENLNIDRYNGGSWIRKMTLSND
tara:strand:- start:544 stop:1014 length:471 start_codon:yes stop_codon:yes gene_type:complete